MSEIEKMYENANIKICKRKQGFTLKDCTDRDCKECGYYTIPPFTAEKQLEIVCFLINRGVELSFNCEQGKINMQAISRGLAGIVNRIWQDLTEEEKQQVRGILE